MQVAACLDECPGILLPSGLVEVDGKKEARLVLEQRVDAGDERPSEWQALALNGQCRGCVLRHSRFGPPCKLVSGQVPVDDLVGHRKKPPVRSEEHTSEL